MVILMPPQATVTLTSFLKVTMITSMKDCHLTRAPAQGQRLIPLLLMAPRNVGNMLRYVVRLVEDRPDQKLLAALQEWSDR